MENNNHEGDEPLEYRSVTLVVAPTRLPRCSEGGFHPTRPNHCLTDADLQRQQEDEEDIGELERGRRMELSFEGRRALYEVLGRRDAVDDREEEDEEDESDGELEDRDGVVVLRCRAQ
ncbi:hypothetical protein PRZ48_005441 [Zasmidium cellare]|uniref:Uncharacterized protein n=1 Tax=Zasmidium cellare TaxID=395010 RepID=A0ABR0ETT2_ZASCE|nr:hypothetical protein PRZ48_005441 [Zasmidium cellare]